MNLVFFAPTVRRSIARGGGFAKPLESMTQIRLLQPQRGDGIAKRIPVAPLGLIPWGGVLVSRGSAKPPPLAIDLCTVGAKTPNLAASRLNQFFEMENSVQIFRINHATANSIFFAPTVRRSIARGEGFAEPLESLTLIQALQPQRGDGDSTMPQSLADVTLHLVYSTKHREPRIEEAWAPRLYDFLGGIARTHKSILLSAGGMPDHVHLLISMGREVAIADLVRDLKAGSSRWIHESFADQSAFAWQSGYGVFSVSHSLIANVRTYIQNQREHHRIMIFQDEFRELMNRHEIKYDDRYMWD